MLSLGIAGVMTGGFVGRFAPEDRYLASLSKPEMGKYVEGRFEKLRLKPFDANDKRPKVVLVGDSYAQDLANAIFESGLQERFQLSTHLLSATCGNLYMQTDLTPHVEPQDRATCARRTRYEDPRLQKPFARPTKSGWSRPGATGRSNCFPRAWPTSNVISARSRSSSSGARAWARR